MNKLAIMFVLFLSVTIFSSVYCISTSRSNAWTSSKCVNNRVQNQHQHQHRHRMSEDDAVTTGDSLIFGGIKLYHPVSSSLRNQGILVASDIQQAALAPIMTGLNCVVHAETGSGKTLAYILPMLKRMVAVSSTLDTTQLGPLQALIVVPSHELGLQVAADINNLLGGVKESSESIKTATATATAVGPRLTYVCENEEANFNSIVSPILISTPRTLRKKMQNSPMSACSALTNVRYLVLDEVDRMLETLGKYATQGERTLSKQIPNDANLFLTKFVEMRKLSRSLEQMQIVAASATVGRPLRRELAKIFDTSDASSYGGDFAAIRAAKPDEESQSKNNGKTAARQVNIPADILHYILLLKESDQRPPLAEAKTKSKLMDRISFSSSSSGSNNPGRGRQVETKADVANSLSSKMSAVDKIWNADFKRAKKGILFVPTSEEIPQVLGMLRFWGWKGVQTIKSSGGSDKIIDSAAESEEGDGRELFVISAQGARGIHIPDVECVMNLIPPATMDEYLHMAGRTGRIGNKIKGGSVISLVEFEDLKRLQAWQTPLGIQFKVKYQS